MFKLQGGAPTGRSRPRPTPPDLVYPLTPAVRTILIATVAVFFLQITVAPITGLLEFTPREVLLRPWSLVTYMLVHGGFGHIFFNMLGLFFFGPRVEERIGTNRFWGLYLASGITGALLSFVLTPYASIIGASGAVYGVMLAFAYFWPQEQILIWGVLPVPAWMLVGFYVLVSLFYIKSGGGGNTAHWAHLGGIAGGFLWLKWIERGRGQFRRKVAAAPPRVDQEIARWKQVDRTNVHALNREELDRILDKINAQGLGSLTPQERIFLSNFVPKDDRPPVS